MVVFALKKKPAVRLTILPFVKSLPSDLHSAEGRYRGIFPFYFPPSLKKGESKGDFSFQIKGKV